MNADHESLITKAFENLPSDTTVTREDVDAILTWVLPVVSDEPARPVEDREPVGPYAPTRAKPLPGEVQADIAAQRDARTFEAGYRQGWRERDTPGCTPRYPDLTIRDSVEPVQMVQFKEAFERGRAAGKDEQARDCKVDHDTAEDAAFNRGLDKGFERGRQQGDADRAQRLNGVEMVSNDWAQDTAADHFRRGRKLGAAEREAELLDQGWTPPGAVVDLVSNGLHGNEAATEAGWEAAKMMGAETPYSVVGGIINAAIPHLSGAYIAAPERDLATDAEMNAPISDQARRNVIEALKAQVKRRDGAIQRYEDALTEATRSRTRPACNVEAGMTLGSPCACGHLVGIHDLITPGGPIECGPCKAEAAAAQVHTLEVTSGPTDYEVWRDALTLAVQEATHDNVVARAEFFRDKLINYPTISPADANQASDDQINHIDGDHIDGDETSWGPGDKIG